jgi:hypothetical protein
MTYKLWALKLADGTYAPHLYAGCAPYLADTKKDAMGDVEGTREKAVHVLVTITDIKRKPKRKGA